MMWRSIMAMVVSKSAHSPRNNAMASSEGWTGRLIARILPIDGEADFEYIHKPQSRRMDPHQLLGMHSNDYDDDDDDDDDGAESRQERTPLDLSQVGDSSRAALTSQQDRWTTMDILLTKPGHSTEERVHMNRATQELVSSAFQRLELSVAKKLERTLSQDELRARTKLERKQSKQQQQQQPIPSQQTVYKHASGDEWNVQNVCNGDFFAQVATECAPGEIWLSVSSEDATIPLAIDSCPPSITAVRAFDNFEGRVYVGVPLVVDVDLIYASGAIVDWYVGGELVCSDCALYTPTLDNIGKEVAVMIRPVRPGHDGREYKEAYRFVHVVEERPLNGILPLRQDWTRKRVREKDSLRVMTFNILANEKAYMDSRENNCGLYPYCDDEYLNRNRRMPLILHEILAHQSDVVCLQEVDASTFASLFHPALSQKGYQGYYRKKMGTREGIAMFWSLDIFEQASEEDLQDISIQKLFPASNEECLEDWESMREVCAFLEQDDDLKSIVTEKLGHVVQIATLTLKGATAKKLVVSNTHLFFHSMGHHIRLLQLFVICHALEKQRQGHPLLFCGDFNSTPHSGGVRLLLERNVAPDHHSAWKHLDTFSWEEQDHGEATEDAAGMSGSSARTPPTISLPESFPLLQSGYAEFPAFTHFITDFCGTLDYILSSQPSETEPYGWVRQKSAPMPSKAEIEKHVAMPGKCWPSDHVSLVCDFKLQHYKER